MFVENIMTREVLHVGPEASFSQVSEIMRLKKVRHVPVIDQDRKVLGIISHRDVQRAQPSMITTLDVGEVKYLLSKIAAADIMHKSVVSCSPRTQIEEAARMMRPKKLGCLTVVDDAGRLVGIVTSVDLLDFFLDITGCWVEGATRITVKLQDRAGQLAALLASVNAQGGYIVSVVSPRTPRSEGLRTATIRFEAKDAGAVVQGLREAGYELSVDQTA